MRQYLPFQQESKTNLDSTSRFPSLRSSKYGVVQATTSEQKMESLPFSKKTGYTNPIIIQRRPQSYDEFIQNSYDERDHALVAETVLPIVEAGPPLDPDFGLVEQWALAQRQGDSVDDTPERITYRFTDDFTYNKLPNLRPYPIPDLDHEYERLVEYAQDQEQELSHKPRDSRVPPPSVLTQMRNRSSVDPQNICLRANCPYTSKRVSQVKQARESIKSHSPTRATRMGRPIIPWANIPKLTMVYEMPTPA